MSTKKGIIKDVNGNPLYAKTDINLVDGFPEPRPVDMGKYLSVGDNLEYEWKDQEQGVTVIANPTLSGGEPNLTSLQVGTSKYAIEQGITQSDADNRYLQLSGGHMTGTINLGPGVSLRDNSGDQVFYRMSSSIDFGEKLNVNFRTDSGNKLYHKIGNNQYEILDTTNTEANPTLGGSESSLTGLKVNGTSYKVDQPNDATLTITQNGTSKGTFTANASNNTTIALTDTTYSSQAAAQGGTTESLVTTGEKYVWNNKQDALSTQTAYTSKGSATKVPQITTNTLGQVTGITEVTITQPPVNNATLTVTQNGTSKGTFTANSSTDTTIALTDTTYESKSAASGGTDVSLVTTGEKYTWNNKQNALPNVVNDRYLHTNASTGALEWTQVQSDSIYSISLSGSSGTITTNVNEIATHLINDEQIQIIRWNEPDRLDTYLATRFRVDTLLDEGTKVTLSIEYNDTKPYLEQWEFTFDLEAASPSIAWERVHRVGIPVSTSNDAGKIIGVNNNGSYALVEQSSLIFSMSLAGSSGTITTDVSTIANHLVNDKQIQITSQHELAAYTYMLDKNSISHPDEDDYTVVIFSSIDNVGKPTLVKWVFDFDLTDATPVITWEKTYVDMPVPDSGDAGKVIGVNNNGEYRLVQPSTPNTFHIDVTSQGMSGTITTDVANVASHMKNDDLLWINGFVCSLASRMVVSDEYFMAIYTADYYDATDFGQVSFYFVCTAYATGITFTETITKIPLPTTNDSGKVISVDSNGRFVLTQQSSNVPTPTSSDANKILTVNAQGQYVLDSITNLADVYNGQVV